MIEIIKELNIEVTKQNIFQAIVAKQYDMNTRFLKVTFMDSGTRINIPYIETARVFINAERKDGQAKGFDGVINEDGTVTVPLHSWMLELDGTVICDISIIDTAADDNKKLTTTSFALLVEKAAYGGDAITNDPQYDVLISLLNTCASAGTIAQEALDKSNEANSKYDACVQATDGAVKAAEELDNIKTELAEGGFITGIKEKNHGAILGFWVGTTEEYAALAEKPTNAYVILTDDKTIQNMNNQLNAFGQICGKFNKVLLEYEDAPPPHFGNDYTVNVPGISNYNIIKMTTGNGVTVTMNRKHSTCFEGACVERVFNSGGLSELIIRSYQLLLNEDDDGSKDKVFVYGYSNTYCSNFNFVSTTATSFDKWTYSASSFEIQKIVGVI